MITHAEWSKTAVAGIALAAGLLCIPSPAPAQILPPSCGDGICTPLFENANSCVADCGKNVLSVTLPYALKQPGCAGDDDGDCLYNFAEDLLALYVSPLYFYDEDESCSGASYTDGPDPVHYGRRDFFQVRPVGASVSSWSTSGPSVKTVQLTYFLLHPHDCNRVPILGIGGHQGDPELVRYILKSLDLRTWYLVSSQYHHHGKDDGIVFSGEYLRARANELGTKYPSVAADEDGHGSWPGLNGSSTYCAGSEDDFCHSTCDCFAGTMKGAFDDGFYEHLTAGRNIGGPSPEKWRPSVVTVSGSDAYSILDVGHDPQREYWTRRTDSFQKFCGWECPTRDSNGNCTVERHDETECSGSLSEKLDCTAFGVAGAPPIPCVGILAAASSTATAPSAARLPSPESEAVRQRLRDGLAAAVGAVASLSEQAEGFERRLAVAADPLETLVPLLAGRTREEQLETIAWMLKSVPEKLASALDSELLRPGSLHPAKAGEAAAELLKAAVNLLQAEGYRAPEASEDDR